MLLELFDKKWCGGYKYSPTNEFFSSVDRGETGLPAENVFKLIRLIEKSKIRILHKDLEKKIFIRRSI